MLRDGSLVEVAGRVAMIVGGPRRFQGGTGYRCKVLDDPGTVLHAFDYEIGELAADRRQDVQAWLALEEERQELLYRVLREIDDPGKLREAMAA